jgi:phosphate starvation-inducible PhoH-like protein
MLSVFCRAGINGKKKTFDIIMRNKKHSFKRNLAYLINDDLFDYNNKRQNIYSEQNGGIRRNFFSEPAHKSKLENLSENKLHYVEQLNNEVPIVICTGPTGTGKTFLACHEAISQLEKYKKILITRPAVSIHNEQHGFLPGSLEDKMAPWFRPIYDNIEDSFGKEYLEYLLKNKIIDICPFAYIRGRTFNNTFVIADEMQNATRMQFQTLLTRIGKESKMVINGDIQQTDSVDNNGLLDFLTKLNCYSQK